MPRLTLIYPCVGRFPGDRYVRSWQMQPLGIATLAGLTPPDWEVGFYDDRMEPIDFDTDTDLVGITVEAYTARRAYQIAERFRARGVPVVLGGYHASTCPQEALERADAVCVGAAEAVWPRILDDAAGGRLRGTYRAEQPGSLRGLHPDRRIFGRRNYFKMALVETGRGCPFRCDFCSIAARHGGTYQRRPIDEVVAEIAGLKERTVFFVDDNLVGDLGNAKELFRALIPLKIRWISQASVNAAHDPELVSLMARSGCLGLLIGFESLEPANLAGMNKGVNRVEAFAPALARLREAGIVVYGTFVFGYPHDTPGLIRRTVRFGIEQKLFIAAYNHLVPFPGTPLYKQLESEGRLHYPKWWLSDRFRFGDVPWEPESIGARALTEQCLAARRTFFSIPSILRRATDRKANCARPGRATRYFALNALLRREVAQKRGIPLGVRR